MTALDPDVDRIIDQEVEDDRLRMLVREVLEWEAEKLHQTVRTNKKNELDRMITEYLKDA